LERLWEWVGKREKKIRCGRYCYYNIEPVVGVFHFELSHMIWPFLCIFSVSKDGSVDEHGARIQSGVVIGLLRL
jgi:hypothetical protein